MRALVLALLLVACGHKDAADLQKKRDDATQALAEYRAASDDVARTLPDLLSKLTSKVIFDAAGAAKQLGEEILPKLDAYLAASERAVTTSELYLAAATDVGSDVVANVDKLRRRLGALHIARDQLAKVQTALAAHPSVSDLEQIARDLTTAGMALVTAP